MSQERMTNRQNEGIPHERNTVLRYPRPEIVRNIVPTNVHRNLGSFSNESIRPLGINPRSPTLSAQGFSNQLFGSNILLNQRRTFDPNGPQYQMGNTTSSRDTRCLPIKRRSSENSSSREYEVGESSTRRRVHPFENNPNNNYLSMSSTPLGHVNSPMNFNFNGDGRIPYNNFQSYEQGGSSSSSQIGMGSWAPSDHLILGSYQNPNTNFDYSNIQHLNAPSSIYIHNTVNIYQYVMLSPTSHFVTPSPTNVQASSSSFNPLPSDVQQNQMIGSRTCEQNQLFFSRARVGENFEHILTSTSPQLRTERNRLRDQMYEVQQEQLNSGFVAADDVIITRYSRALDILDAQERLDQLNSGAWRYVIEMGLHEEEIMEYIRHDFFQSSAEEQDETCAICQEDYLDGEHIGLLDCGHKYHLDCIKQWLLRKNMCPVCKQRALNVED